MYNSLPFFILTTNIVLKVINKISFASNISICVPFVDLWDNFLANSRNLTKPVADQIIHNAGRARFDDLNFNSGSTIRDIYTVTQ